LASFPVAAAACARTARSFVKIDYVCTVNDVVAQAVLGASSLQAIPAPAARATAIGADKKEDTS
jgi:hypothetical protein